MNTKSSMKQSGIIAGALVALAMMASPQDVRATTFANTSIQNTVTVGYKSLGNVDYSASATVTVTVNLVPAAPTLAFVSQLPVATLAAPTDEVTSVTQTYNLVSNSNGLVQHNIQARTYTATDISAATGALAASTLWLGATTLGVQADGTAVIYVPLDTCAGVAPCTYSADNAAIGGLNGIVANDYVVIDGTKYQVTAIDNTAAAAAALDADLQGKFAKLTLDGNVPNTVLPGTPIGESRDFTISMTTGTLDPTKVTGNYTLTLTADDGAGHNGPEASNGDAVYVARCNLTITKAVSTDGGGSWVTSTAGTSGTGANPGTPGSAGPTPSDPNKELRYRITVSSDNTGKTCKNVTITDNLSPYVALSTVNVPTVTAGASGLNPLTATTTYLDQANAGYTPLVSTGGGAPANYDANVHQWKIDFGAQQMSPNASFTIDYRGWLF